jgi:hypothetical protein
LLERPNRALSRERIGRSPSDATTKVPARRVVLALVGIAIAWVIARRPEGVARSGFVSNVTRQELCIEQLGEGHEDVVCYGVDEESDVPSGVRIGDLVTVHSVEGGEDRPVPLDVVSYVEVHPPPGE